MAYPQDDADCNRVVIGGASQEQYLRNEADDQTAQAHHDGGGKGGSLVAGVDTTGNTSQLAINGRQDSKVEQPESVYRDQEVLPDAESNDSTIMTLTGHDEEAAAQTNYISSSQQTNLVSHNSINVDNGNDQHKIASNTSISAAGETQPQDQADHTSSSSAAVQHQPSMAPPNAPASMLWKMKSSKAAKRDREQRPPPDLFISARLVSVTVTLFRMGKAMSARALGQYTIDLIGEKEYLELLSDYMLAPPLADAPEWIWDLLQGAIINMKGNDPRGAAFLAILVDLITGGES